MTPRIANLQATIRALNRAGVRRTTFYPLVAESLRATQGQPRPIRRARALEHLLDSVAQEVLPHERIAGSILGMWPLAQPQPTYEAAYAEAAAVVREHRARCARRDGAPRWAAMARDHYDASIEYADLQKIFAGLKQNGDTGLSDAELFRLLETHFEFDYGEEVRALFVELPWYASNHCHLNYGKLLACGFGGLKRRLAQRLAAERDSARQAQYEAMLISLNAAARFIVRYAATLNRAACDAPDPARAAELGEMAAIAARVAEHPPASFRDALQLVWFAHLIGNIGGGSALSFARFDQYLYPFYQADVEAGILSRDAALELLECVFLKVNEPKMRTVQSLCVGGLVSEEQDGANTLSALCLEAIGELGEPYPNVCLRVSRLTPPALLEKAIATIKLGHGQPMLFNDDVMIPALVERGYPFEDANDYYNMGCVEVMLAGKTAQWTGSGGAINLADLIEIVLHDGALSRGGQKGLPTGAPSAFTTFDAFLAAYLEQLRFCTLGRMAEAEERRRHAPPHACDPFASALLDSCVESGLDAYQGGSTYPAVRPLCGVGLGTAVDSLSAIRKFVFEDRVLTLDELRDALDRNYDGHEPLRRLLSMQTPCFGNDIDAVDELAARLMHVFTETVLAHPAERPDGFVPLFLSYNDSLRLGEVTAATPNGRLAGQPISDGPGPSQGRDILGPTCLINSVTKIDLGRIVAGYGFNVKLSPGFLKGEPGSALLRSLVAAYFERGGLQIQFNVIDQETLRQAQQQPEAYQNVIVRVAGYCEHFVKLDRGLQNEIIQRTCQDNASEFRL
ncbi:MAG: pyruvate formate lyase [Kiritimatiellae bacterium]|nr:pyruvate formate lyase [Kiritimatiellia bacterium]